MTPTEALKHYFGYTEFKAGQKKVIDLLLGHKNTLALLPTGGGKSLCYQIPALLEDGLTLVISPLISLMKDICPRFNFFILKVFNRFKKNVIG